jgi:hypothetical protein
MTQFPPFPATSCRPEGKLVFGVLAFAGESEDRRNSRKPIFIVKGRKFIVAADSLVSSRSERVVQFGVDFYKKLPQLFKNSNNCEKYIC